MSQKIQSKINNQSTSTEIYQKALDSINTKTRDYHKDIDCLNPQCAVLNGKIGKWRISQGAKGGGKAGALLA